MTRNRRIRFCANNYAEGATLTYSSQDSSYPLSNTQIQSRSKVGRFGGYFEITSENQNVYINDGSDKTVALTIGTYTYSTLASHVQTRLNASSSNWTCTYDFNGGTFKFTIDRSSGTEVLRFSQSTNAAWDTLGFTGLVDDNSGPFVADEPRNHTGEFLKWDFGTSRPIGFFAAIGKITKAFGLSSAANIYLMANSVDDFTNPPMNLTLSPHDRGIMRFQDDLDDYSYRYLKFGFDDRLNPCGPKGFEIGHVYAGDYETYTTTSVNRGFDKKTVDPSLVNETDAGALFFLKRPKYRTWQNMEIENVAASERRIIEDLYEDVGLSKSFYLSLDPTLTLSEELQELTVYGNFASDPRWRSVIRDVFTQSLEFREAV